MIQGHVRELQARVGVVFRIPNRPPVEIEFVVDTGFEGALTLPPEAVAALELPFLQEMNANLANDLTFKTDAYIATIHWNGADIQAVVLAMGRRPLLGTALLEGRHLGVDFADSGLVSIDRLS
jgi:clan AA aspartic protease